MFFEFTFTVLYCTSGKPCPIESKHPRVIIVVLVISRVKIDDLKSRDHFAIPCSSTSEFHDDPRRKSSYDDILTYARDICHRIKYTAIIMVWLRKSRRRNVATFKRLVTFAQFFSRVEVWRNTWNFVRVSVVVAILYPTAWKSREFFRTQHLCSFVLVLEEERRCSFDSRIILIRWYNTLATWLQRRLLGIK